MTITQLQTVHPPPLLNMQHCWFVVHIDRGDMLNVVEQCELATHAHSFSDLSAVSILSLKKCYVVLINLLFNLLNIISDS
jgi:hypothetical protein